MIAIACTGRRLLRRRPRLVFLAAYVGLLPLLAGCTDILEKSADFDRHRYSQFSLAPDKPGIMYFDVMNAADFPLDDPAAEVARQAWLAGWLKQRQLCPAGHDVVEQRPFDYLEDNPAHYDQRYVVRCKAAPTGPAAGASPARPASASQSPR
jgi:hypothetical protein